MLTLSNTPNRLESLIHASAERAGSDYKLAKAIGYTRQEISMWKARKRPCPIAAQALMAAMAERDVQREIADALIEQNADTPRGEKLISALGKGLMSAGGLTAITLYGNDASASSAIVLVDVLRCIFRAFL